MMLVNGTSFVSHNNNNSHLRRVPQKAVLTPSASNGNIGSVAATVVTAIGSSATKNESGTRKLKKVQSTPDIIFLQQRQEELLKALHIEIQDLKRENSELKFQLYVISQQNASEVRPAEARQNASNIFKQNGSETCEKTLDHLISTESPETNSKDLKTEAYEKCKISRSSRKDAERSQQVYYMHSSTAQIELLDEKWDQKKMCPTCRTSIVNSTIDRHHHSTNLRARQRSSSASSKLKFLAEDELLPSDYKEAVATLPPINLKPRRISTTDANKFKGLDKIRRASWSIPQSSKFDPSLLTKRKSSIQHSGLITTTDMIEDKIALFRETNK